MLYRAEELTMKEKLEIRCIPKHFMINQQATKSRVASLKTLEFRCSVRFIAKTFCSPIHSQAKLHPKTFCKFTSNSRTAINTKLYQPSSNTNNTILLKNNWLVTVVFKTISREIKDTVRRQLQKHCTIYFAALKLTNARLLTIVKTRALETNLNFCQV